MEPLSDGELEHLLSVWVAPEAPQSLGQRLFSGRRRWWRWLFSRPSLIKRWRLRKRFRKA